MKRNNGSMPGALLPLFPLQLVVFPRTSVPLHIFEERYKEMVGEALRDNSEFGIVLAREEGIVNAGCTVVVEKVIKTYPDGRMDVVTSGRRRFEIFRLNEEKDYLQAEVQFFDDEDATPPDATARRLAVANFEQLRTLGTEEPFRPPDLADPQLSFQLAQLIPDLDFLSVLLRTRSEPERLKELNEYCRQYIPRQKAIAHAREVAPRNGFGGKPAGIQ